MRTGKRKWTAGELANELSKYPADTKVQVSDWRKGFRDEDGDGRQMDGEYGEFEVEYGDGVMDEDGCPTETSGMYVDEDGDGIAMVCISIDNDDYDDMGRLTEDAVQEHYVEKCASDGGHDKDVIAMKVDHIHAGEVPGIEICAFSDIKGRQIIIEMRGGAIWASCSGRDRPAYHYRINPDVLLEAVRTMDNRRR